ncbi:MAG TPA: thiol-disulfide oxidoreductase [Lysinibacillus sp.]|jgi:peroxiredoxin|uniref:Thiol-disulfide oxidoreductase n=3 Tax=Lysinibacillus TaxID=400634 RepID=A0A0M9DPC5_9BACI|nr:MULTISPECIES: thiol-disulfide oxidoreductase ResA [Lysinibacillus]WHP40809.1 thiol-disulfide oxidoreductase ResA [Lysinibacillus boronitolerans]AJK85937.1 thiol-disulfide oxidoreductase [Lysinibacillus fusiformis]KGR89297.1 thiol-disulfide oxidoreductase [Lysinibacillus boronitolerans JCM 21713 = 10a = NBRC 103108]KHK52041.1 thiol-disulfide oxidoreductase [Lysinibacillus sp. A1]KOY84242.1 thiol-disulfide oxidoreductase [Lysinibacillus macroides]
MDKKKRRFLMRSIILIVLFGAILFTVYTTLTKEKNEVLQIGDNAPNFTLVDMYGDKHNLEEYKGQGVFLNFWGTWCKPCEREFPIIDRYYKEYKEKGIQVLAINIAESDFVVQNYIDRKGLTFPVLIDKNKSVMEAYNINPLPTTILINSEGKIEKIITGEMKEQDIKSYMEQILPD